MSQCELAQDVPSCKWGVLLGSYTAKGGKETGADETAWRQSTLVHPATLFAPVRYPPRTMLVVQRVTGSMNTREYPLIVENTR